MKYPADQLKNPLWQRKRLEIMNRDKFKCRLCGAEDKTLHVHHKRYVPGCKLWEYDNGNFVTLCEYCHYEIEHLKTVYSDVHIEDVNIIHSTDWDNDSRIVFLTLCPDVFGMRFYDNNNKFIIGYSFDKDEFKKIINNLYL